MHWSWDDYRAVPRSVRDELVAMLDEEAEERESRG